MLWVTVARKTPHESMFLQLHAERSPEQPRISVTEAFAGIVQRGKGVSMQGKEAGEAIAELLNQLEIEGFEFNPTDGVIYLFRKGTDGRLYTLGRITEGSMTEATGWSFVMREGNS